jgi:hypothetical protein
VAKSPALKAILDRKDQRGLKAHKEFKVYPGHRVRRELRAHRDRRALLAKKERRAKRAIPAPPSALYKLTVK